VNATAKASTIPAYRWLGLDQSDRFIQGFREAGLQVDKHFFAFRCDSHLVNWEALKAGLGVGVAPHWIAKTESTLQRIEIGAEVPSLPVWLTSHRELKNNQRIRTVFDFLAKELQAIA
jgi:DNA-binding transcriptional LysR family regulator